MVLRLDGDGFFFARYKDVGNGPLAQSVAYTSSHILPSLSRGGRSRLNNTSLSVLLLATSV